MILQEVAKISSVSCDHHGVNMDTRGADSGSGGAGPSGLHLHHHGGLPRTHHLPHLCGVLQASQRGLHQMLEGKGQ